MEDTELFTNVVNSTFKEVIPNYTSLADIMSQINNQLPEKITLNTATDIGSADRTNITEDSLIDYSAPLSDGILKISDGVSDYIKNEIEPLQDSILLLITELGSGPPTPDVFSSSEITIKDAPLGVLTRGSDTLETMRMLFDQIAPSFSRRAPSSIIIEDYINNSNFQLSKLPASVDPNLVMEKLSFTHNRAKEILLNPKSRIQSLFINSKSLGTVKHTREFLDIVEILNEAYTACITIRENNSDQNVLDYFGNIQLALLHCLMGCDNLLNTAYKDIVIYYISGNGEIVINPEMVNSYRNDTVSFPDIAKMMFCLKLLTNNTIDPIVTLRYGITLDQLYSEIPSCVQAYDQAKETIAKAISDRDTNCLIENFSNVLKKYLYKRNIDTLNGNSRIINSTASELTSAVSNIAVSDVVTKFVLTTNPPKCSYVANYFKNAELIVKKLHDSENEPLLPIRSLAMISTGLQFLTSDTLGLLVK